MEEVCDMTIQTVLDQFPSLQGCVCTWEEELCDAIQVLATQCHRKPGAVFSVSSEKSIYREITFLFTKGNLMHERGLLCFRMSVKNNRLTLIGIYWIGANHVSCCLYSSSTEEERSDRLAVEQFNRLW